MVKATLTFCIRKSKTQQSTMITTKLPKEFAHFLPLLSATKMENRKWKYTCPILCAFNIYSQLKIYTENNSHTDILLEAIGCSSGKSTINTIILKM